VLGFLTRWCELSTPSKGTRGRLHSLDSFYRCIRESRVCSSQAFVPPHGSPLTLNRPTRELTSLLDFIHYTLDFVARHAFFRRTGILVFCLFLGHYGHLWGRIAAYFFFFFFRCRRRVLLGRTSIDRQNKCPSKSAHGKKLRGKSTSQCSCVSFSQFWTNSIQRKSARHQMSFHVYGTVRRINSTYRNL
jgi:hypothetical protein